MPMLLLELLCDDLRENRSAGNAANGGFFSGVLAALMCGGEFCC